MVKIYLPSVFYRHSAKTLPSAETNARQKKITWRRGDGHGVFAKCLTASGLGKHDLVCQVPQPWHSANNACLPSVPAPTLGKWSMFAECHIPDTRQRMVIPDPTFGLFVECPGADTRQRSYFSPRIHRFLPRVRFVECIFHGTRQIVFLPSVTLGKAATYNQFIWFDHSHVPHSNKHHILSQIVHNMRHSQFI